MKKRFETPLGHVHSSPIEVRDDDTSGVPPRPMPQPLNLNKADACGSALEDQKTEMAISPLADPIENAIRVGRERLASQGSQVDCSSIDGFRNANSLKSSADPDGGFMKQLKRSEVQSSLASSHLNKDISMVAEPHNDE